VRRPQLRLRGALLVGTLIPLLLTGVVSLVTVAALTNSLTDAEAAARSQQILSTADKVTNDILEAETGVRGFIIGKREVFLEPYSRATAALPADLASLRTLLQGDATQLARLQDIETTFRDWLSTTAEPVVASVRAGTYQNAVDIVAAGDGKARIDRIRDDVNDLVGAVQAVVAARAITARDSATTARRISFYGTFIAIIMGVIIAVIFARRVTRRVRRVSRAAMQLASGDLSQRVTLTGHDEIAELGNAFNTMAARLETAAASEHAITDELRRRTNEAELANRELESFSYSVSHDLRAPLRSMDGFSQALSEDYADKLDDTAKDYIARIRAASLRMAALIDDLLQLSRLTRDAVRSEPVDLSAISSAVVDELRAAEPGRNVDVSIQPGMRAVGDPRLVRIALVNLIGNAWKFTRERADARIDVRQEVGPNGPEFVVADNGAGFDMRYAANLFGPFQRMHPAERFAGTGIGLATVQRIVHRHGGTIRAESAVGEGARFRFTLGPAGGGAGPTTAPGLPDDAVSSAGPRNVASTVSAVQGGASSGR